MQMDTDGKGVPILNAERETRSPPSRSPFPVPRWFDLRLGPSVVSIMELTTANGSVIPGRQSKSRMTPLPFVSGDFVHVSSSGLSGERGRTKCRKGDWQSILP